MTASGATYPAVSRVAQSPVSTVPATLLEAIGWVESGWRQSTGNGAPLVSFDFGYGVMQVTSGMPGAFGNVTGDLDPRTASRVASEYKYNIAYGMHVLLQKLTQVPKIGTGDPAVLEDWYYAVWAYNGWGWVNNPNNPRFSRQGTPATDPNTYPYQERVFYLVAHPPRDASGNPLWRAIPVTMPGPNMIGSTPHAFTPRRQHQEQVAAFSAVYRPSTLVPALPSATQAVRVRVTNTGTSPWFAGLDSSVSLTYHLVTGTANPWRVDSPFSPGVIAFGQDSIPAPRDVLPGKSMSFDAAVQAPASVGTYWIVWDLEGPGGTWFSQAGILPRAEKLRVTTQAPTPLPALTPTPAPPKSVESMSYVADTSIPDGSTVRARAPFIKGWLVYNDGKSAWGPGWVLVRVRGNAFGAPHTPVPSTAPCHALNLLASMRAPSRAGSYHSVWRLRDPTGKLVGTRLTLVVDVRASGPAPPTVTPAPTSTPVIRPGPTPTSTPSG